MITPHTAQLPPLRVVGQVGALYIIAEGPEGLYLIDQHAAHERILYEQFMAQRYGQDKTNAEPSEQSEGVPQQHLLEPLTLHIGHELTGLVAHHLDELQTVGFSVEPFGGDTFLVRAVPAVLSGQDPLRALEEIVSSLTQQRNQVGEELEARLVKMICKRAAIKAGQMLSPLEMQELVRQLEACQSPRTCPHGRPTMIQLIGWGVGKGLWTNLISRGDPLLPALSVRKPSWKLRASRKGDELLCPQDKPSL